MAANPTRTYLTTTFTITTTAGVVGFIAAQHQPNPWAYAITASAIIAAITAPFICPIRPEDTNPTWTPTDSQPPAPAPNVTWVPYEPGAPEPGGVTTT